MLQIPHLVPNNTVTPCSLCPPSSLTHIFTFQNQKTALAGFTRSQAVISQQNQLFRPHHLSLLAIWRNRDSPGQRAVRWRNALCEIPLLWPSVSITKWDTAPLSPQVSNSSWKIQAYSLHFKRLKLHIHVYTYTFTSWNTSCFTYFKKDLMTT